MIHQGETQIPAGRYGEAPANGLSQRLLALPLRLGRLKTGTPPRLASHSIDWADCRCRRATIRRSLFLSHHPYHHCASGLRHHRTNAATHALIRANLNRHRFIVANRRRGPALLSLHRG
jgi:tRNA uridine 5-carboxymethylaminomethyl modification enzyme